MKIVCLLMSNDDFVLHKYFKSLLPYVVFFIVWCYGFCHPVVAQVCTEKNKNDVVAHKFMKMSSATKYFAAFVIHSNMYICFVKCTYSACHEIHILMA